MRILILEDEYMIAMCIQDILELADIEVVGPFGSASQAMESIAEGKPDGALLDYNLGQGRNSLEVAAELLRRDIPFAFLTGYANMEFEAPFNRVPRIIKPGSDESILKAVQAFSSPC